MKRLLPLVALLTIAAAPFAPADFAWQQHPGAAVPLDPAFTDESGRPLRFGQAIQGGPPILLDVGYFHCPSLCGTVRSDAIAALTEAELVPGRDYRLVSLSIDPAETPSDAATARTQDLQEAGLAEADWHYLTGPPASIAAITEAVGFKARFDPAQKQFLHPAGLVVLTPEGRVSAYLLGVGYDPAALRTALLGAGRGEVAQAALPILLLCFHFDAATGRYTLAIEKVLRLMAGLTVITLGGLLIVLHRTGRLPKRSP